MVVEKSGYLGSFAQLNMTAPCAVHISWKERGTLEKPYAVDIHCRRCYLLPKSGVVDKLTSCIPMLTANRTRTEVDIRQLRKEGDK